MYLEAAIIYSLIALESIGEQIFLPQLMGQDNSFIFSIISTVMIFLIGGFTGNVLYIKKSLRVVDKAKKITSNIGLIITVLVLIAIFKGSIN